MKNESSENLRLCKPDRARAEFSTCTVIQQTFLPNENSKEIEALDGIRIRVVLLGKKVHVLYATNALAER